MQRNETFERLMSLDYDVRVTHAQATFAQTAEEAAAKNDLLRARKDKFFAALDALTPEESAQFLSYRRAALNGEVA